MGRSRNQRSKSEGTFLEHVLSTLQVLREEVKSVKDNLQNLTACYNPVYYTHNFPPYSLAEDGVPNQQSWNVLAQEFIPERSVTLDRGRLLAYRSACEADDDDGKLGWSVQSVSDQHPLKTKNLDVSSATCIQKVFRGHRARRAVLCHKCLQKSWKCDCEDILCSACFKSADICSCRDPYYRRRICTQCNLTESFCLHTDNFLPSSVASFRCIECGGSEYSFGDWHWLMASDHYCQTCGRRDGQLQIQMCEGPGCETLHHMSCMVEVAKDTYLCKQCSETGVQLAGYLDDPGDGSDGQQIEHTWDDLELQTWVRVSMRMAGRLADNNSRINLIRQRWQQAQCHVPREKRPDMSQLVDEICTQIANWPEG